MHYLKFSSCFVFLLLLSCNNKSKVQIFEFDFPSDCCNLTFEEAEILDPRIGNTIVKWFLPCIFSPNNDDTLDQILFLRTNPGINKIVEFEIHAQDGTLIFSDSEFKPNLSLNGWDGYFEGLLQEGPFQATYTIEDLAGNKYNLNSIVCSIACNSNSSLVEDGLPVEDLRWGSSHDGNGGFDNNYATPEECY